MAAGALLAVGGVPAGAQDAPLPPVGPDAPAPPAALLEVVALPALVGALPGVDEVAWRAVITRAEVDAAAGPPDPWERVVVTAELRGPVTTRSELRAALAGADVTPVLRRRSVALDRRTLDPGTRGRAEGAVPLTGLPPAGEPGGVHPLRLRVLADGVEVARLDTAVVRFDTAPAATLATALVWTLAHPPLLATGDAEADADEAAGLAAAVARDGRLRTAVTALTTADAAVARAVTLAPATHLLEDLGTLAVGPEPAAADARAVLTALRLLASTSASGPVATPHGGADLARLVAVAGGGTADDGPSRVARRVAATAAFEGGRRLLPLLGRTAAPVTLIDRPTSQRALDLVGGTVLLPQAALDLPDADLDPLGGRPVRRLTAASGRIVPAVVADPFLAEAVAGVDRTAIGTRQGGPVAAAQEVLARSALVFLQAPGRDDRGLLMVTPTGLDPDPAAARELLARLGSAPWLTLTGPAALAARSAGADATAAPRAALAEPAVTATPRLAAALAGSDAAVRRALATIEAPDGPPLLGGRTPAALEDAVVRAAGAATGATPGTVVDPTDRALAALAAVRTAAEGALGPVAIAAADLTLTDRAGPLPLSVANAGALPLRVAVELVGPAGLAWPDGRVRSVLLPAGGDVALEVPVVARGTGTFPVVVRVLDATGGELATVALSVRSTAVAGPALVGIAAAIAVMTAVGLVRQRRRGRRRAA